MITRNKIDRNEVREVMADDPPLKALTLHLTVEDETSLTASLMYCAGQAEANARKLDKLKPGSMLAKSARKRANVKLRLLNKVEEARGLPTTSAEKVCKKHV